MTQRDEAMRAATGLAALADYMARQVGARFVVCPRKLAEYVDYRTAARADRAKESDDG